MSRIIQISETVDKSLGCQPGEKLLCLNAVEDKNTLRKQMENTCKEWLIFLDIKINIYESFEIWWPLLFMENST